MSKTLTRRVNSMLHVAIHEELDDRKWTYSKLADALGVQVGVVSRWLSDNECKRVVPLPQVCASIADVLGMDVVEVFQLAGYLPPMEHKRGLTGPHAEEIKLMLHRLRRTLQGISETDWPVASIVVQTQLEALQLTLDRLDDHHLQG